MSADIQRVMLSVNRFEHLLLVTGEHQAKVVNGPFSPSFTGYPPSIFIITDGSPALSQEN